MVACLCVGAFGSLVQSVPYASLATPHKARPEVKGVAIVPPPECSLKPCIALTFDDGPSDLVTPQVLDILARNQVKATFFLVGQHVPGREPLVHRMYLEGHEIGNHSWNHADFTKLSPSEVDMQLRLSQAAIAGAGVPAPRVFRPPYGAVNPMVQSHVGMTIVRWNIDPEDWRSKNAAEIQAKVFHDARPGGIILMHDTDQATAAALDPVLQTLKQQYQFVTVSELLKLTPGDQGQYFGR
jgi:peptidoglycan/xylan/chitin deacetylase (PgdA/CDA1 family)